MTRQKATVTFKCPSGMYCNYKPTPKDEKAMRLGRRPTLTFGGSKKNVSIDYCRFCTKIKEGVFTCVLHNESLVVEAGWMPLKTRQCRGKSSHIIEEPAEQSTENAQKSADATVNPQELMTWTIDEFFKQYNNLVRQGYPADLCTKVAKAHVLGQDMIIDNTKGLAK